MEHPGAKWEGRAGVILNKFIELDGQYILFRKIDYATEDEIDEIASLAPYHRILDHELHEQEALEYLNKMLPNMPDEDKETAARGYIFKCVAVIGTIPYGGFQRKIGKIVFQDLCRLF